MMNCVHHLSIRGNFCFVLDSRVRYSVRVPIYFAGKPESLEASYADIFLAIELGNE